MYNRIKMSRSKSTDTEFRKNFGKRLRQARMQLKISQNDFAHHLGFSGSFISDLEYGKSNPGIDFLIKIARLFNVNINWLIFGKGEMFYREGEKLSGEDNLFSDLDSNIVDLLKYLKYSTIVKHTVLGFALKFIRENKDTIDKEIESVKTELEKRDI